jgi:hypothetical protein
MPMIVCTRMLYHYLSVMPMSHWFHELSYPCNARNPSLCLQYFFLLFTTVTITAAILLLLLLFHYYDHYKTVATDKPLQARLFPGAAELTTHLLRLTYILWLPLCRINKFRLYFPRRLLRSPILVGHHSPKLLSGNPKLLVDVDLCTELIFVVELTLQQKYQ